MSLAMAITLGIREQYAVRSNARTPALAHATHHTPRLAQLAGIFMLTWATQTYGFLTECAPPFTPLLRPHTHARAHAHTRAPFPRRYISTPKAYTDEHNYKYPVGPYQLQKFAEGAADYGVTDYYRDPAALKLIDQTEWEAVRTLPPAGPRPTWACARG